MGHVIADKKKLIDRIRRIRGQVEAIEKALEDEKGCSAVIHQISACRGAMNGLMAEVVEGHVREHLSGDGRKQAQAAEDLIDVIKSYLK